MPNNAPVTLQDKSSGPVVCFRPIAVLCSSETRSSGRREGLALLVIETEIGHSEYSVNGYGRTVKTVPRLFSSSVVTSCTLGDVDILTWGWM